MDEQDRRPEVQFGAQLRLLRKQAGMTVRQLAARLHRSHSGIVEYENGARLAPIQLVEQYEAFFGLVPGTLSVLHEQARQARLALDGTADARPVDAISPYKGLEAFQHEDADLYFGREAEVEEVLDRLERTRFFAILGPSGSGKSSFVRAGLLAGITAAPSWGNAEPKVVLLTPTDDPLDELARRIDAAIDAGDPIRAGELRTDPGLLARATHRTGGSLVIAVDQLEELFAPGAPAADRRCFVDALMGAWRDPLSALSVVLALRADFYGQLADHPELAAAVKEHHVLLSPMRKGGLLQAIERPAELSRLRLQPGLAQTMLDDLADEPGALPLLSHALFETWKRREGSTLTVSGYRDAGGVRGAIAKTAERTYQLLSEEDRSIARSIMLALTEVGEDVEPTRRRVARADLAAPARDREALDRVLGALANARLVTIERDTVVLAHEALVRHWRRLQAWIDMDRDDLLLHRRLTGAAREWDGLDREHAALYRGARLADAQAWAVDHPEELGGLERDFLAASSEGARRTTHRVRYLRAALAGLAAIIATLGVVALVQRDKAADEADNVRSLALTKVAGEALPSRPDVSLALAFEGYRAARRPEASSAVVRAMIAARESGLRGVLTARDSAFRVAFSPMARPSHRRAARMARSSCGTPPHARRSAASAAMRAG